MTNPDQNPTPSPDEQPTPSPDKDKSRKLTVKKRFEEVLKRAGNLRKDKGSFFETDEARRKRFVALLTRARNRLTSDKRSAMEIAQMLLNDE